MNIDYDTLLYGPIYGTLGTAATLTLIESGVVKSLTVIDKTSGVEVAMSGDVSMNSIKPVCAVRISELTSAGVDLAALKGSVVTFNSGSWRIDGRVPKPGPAGEMKGEVYLILIENHE